MFEPCCPNGHTTLVTVAGVDASTIRRGDAAAADLGNGAHVHVDGDDTTVVRPLAARVLVAYGEPAHFAAFGR